MARALSREVVLTRKGHSRFFFGRILLLSLFTLLSPGGMPAQEAPKAAGVFIYREREFYKDPRLGEAAEYVKLEAEPDAIVVTGTEGVVRSYSRALFIEAIPYQQLDALQDITTAEQAGGLRQSLSRLEEKMARYPKSSPWLKPYTAALAKDLAAFDAGKIRHSGVWIQKSELGALLAKENEASEKARQEALAAEKQREERMRLAAEAQQRAAVEEQARAYGLGERLGRLAPLDFSDYPAELRELVEKFNAEIPAANELVREMVSPLNETQLEVYFQAARVEAGDGWPMSFPTFLKLKATFPPRKREGMSPVGARMADLMKEIAYRSDSLTTPLPLAKGDEYVLGIYRLVDKYNADVRVLNSKLQRMKPGDSYAEIQSEKSRLEQERMKMAEASKGMAAELAERSRRAAAAADRPNLIVQPPAKEDGINLTAIAVGLVLVGACLYGYFIPTHVAFHRRKRNAFAIFILNLVLGWSILGWVGALVWACTED